MKLELLASKLESLSIKKGVSYYSNYKIIINLICLIISLCGVYYLSKFAFLSKSITPIMGIPANLYFFSTLVVGFVGLTLRHMRNIYICLRQKKTKEFSRE